MRRSTSMYRSLLSMLSASISGSFNLASCKLLDEIEVQADIFVRSVFLVLSGK